MTHRQREGRLAIAATFSARDARGAGTLTFTSHDVSTGGAFLRAELLLEQGEALALTFEVPGAGEVTAHAKVAWVRRFPHEGQVPGMGVEFVSLSDQGQRALIAWLRG